MRRAPWRVPMRDPGPADRGSAAVLGTVLVGVLATAALLVAAVGAAVADKRRVEAAADLGALAGAHAVQLGRDGCAAASALVRRNGAYLTGCTTDGDEVTVRAARPTRPLLGRSFTVRSSARAGPAPVSAGEAVSRTDRLRPGPARPTRPRTPP